MNQNLANLFYDPQAGLSGVRDLFKRTRERGYKYSYKQVKEWYEDQPVNQIYKQPQKVKEYNQIKSQNFAPGTFQADLMDFRRVGRYNKGYNYILNIVDIYSRYAWSFPIKRKTPSEIAPHIALVLNEVNPAKIWFTFDQGNEFRGEVKMLLKEKGAEIHLNDPRSLNSHNTMGIIERFNKTLLNKLRKYMTANDTVKYVDALSQIVNKYNHTKHSTINKTPHAVLKQGKTPIIELNESDIMKDNFKINDFVRFRKKNKTFDKKGFIPTYSLNVHKIVGKKVRQYILDNEKAYYPEQLIHAKKGENLSELKKKHQAIQKEERMKRESKKEVTAKDLEKNVIEGKRQRKKKEFKDFVM